MQALWLIADELCWRLENYWTPCRALNIAFDEEIPLIDLYATVDAHDAARTRLHTAEARLRDATYELRMIEVRILTRSVDPWPRPLGRLASLLSTSNATVVDCIDSVNILQKECDRIAGLLGAALHLVLLLLHYKFNLTEDRTSFLTPYFHPEVFAYNATHTADSSPCWEELANSSLSFLTRALANRSAMSQEDKDIGLPEEPGPSTKACRWKTKHQIQVRGLGIASPIMTQMLKGQIALVCDYLDSEMPRLPVAVHSR